MIAGDAQSDLAAARLQIYIAAFCVDAMNFGLVAVVSAHAQYRLDAGALTLGALAVSGRVAYAISAYAIGKRSDQLGSRPLILASLAGSVVVLPFGLFATTLSVLFLYNVVSRILLGLFWSPLERQLSLVSPGRLLWNAIGVLNLWWAAGAVLSFFAIPAMYAAYGLGAPLLVCTALAALPLAIFVLRPPSPHTPTSHAPQESVSVATAMLFVHLGRVANFCAWSAVGALPFFLLRAARAYDIPLATFGALLATSHLTQLVMFAWLWKSPRWHYSLRCLVWVQLLAGVALVFCGVATEALYFFVLLGVFGVFTALSYYSSLFYGLNLRHQEGKASGIHECILALGASFGPLGCSAVGALFPDHPGAPMFFLGAVLLFGAGLEVFLYQRAKRAWPVGQQV